MKMNKTQRKLLYQQVLLLDMQRTLEKAEVHSTATTAEDRICFEAARQTLRKLLQKERLAIAERQQIVEQNIAPDTVQEVAK